MDFASLNLHACMGDSCYCRPGNEAKWRWTQADHDRLTEALKVIAERDARKADRDGI